MFKLLSLALGLTATTLLPATSTARAEVERPMIEVGAGVESQALETFRVLLRVGIDGFTFHREGHSTFVIATVHGNFATMESEGRKIPYMDLEFVPVTMRTGDGLRGGSYRFLPGRYGTNIRLNEDATVRVDVVGIEKGVQGASPFGPKALLFAKVAADAVGYKMAAHLTGEQGTFHGANLAGVSAEAGLAIIASNTFKVRLALGGTADLSVGSNTGDPGLALYSDFSAYAEVSLDIKRFFRLFVRNGLNGVTGAGFDTITEYQLMMGAQIIF
jgi:hypothetical protein